MLASPSRTKPTRNILIVDWECLHEPLPKNRRVADPCDWQWVLGTLVSLQKLTKHFELSLFWHTDYVETHQLAQLAALETWLRRELLTCDILLSRIIQDHHQYPSPNNIRARLSSTPSEKSWWVGHHPLTIRLGEQLNMNTCLMFHPSWTREALTQQDAVTPSLISDSLFNFSEEIIEEIDKLAATT